MNPAPTTPGVVIIGASAAGAAAATALRQRGYQDTITMIGDEKHLAYDRPPLSKQLLAGTQDFEFVQLLTESDVTDLDITLRLETRAVGLDIDAHRVELDGGEALHYGKAIIATGVRPRELADVSGIAEAFTLRSFDDALALRDRLTSETRVLVLGAGFIGLEVAATAVRKGCHVDVVEPAPSPLLGKFPAELTERIRRQHEDQGVTFHMERLVRTWNTDSHGSLSSVTLDDGTELAADVAVIGIGTVPNADWLEGSGLLLENGVRCDASGVAGTDVFAIGDVANWFRPHIGTHMRVEHRTSATEQAHVVAAQICGAEVPGTDLPFFWSDQYDAKWQMYGHLHPDSVLEIVVDDPEANRLVATLRRNGALDAVVGLNAAKQLIPYRRQLKNQLHTAG